MAGYLITFKVTVVGLIIQGTRQATNTLYNIDDGTSRMEARIWTEANEDGSNRPEFPCANTYLLQRNALTLIKGMVNMFA